MLCLVMRLYPTFPPPGLLSTIARHVLNNIPAVVRHSYNLGITSSGTRVVLEVEQNNDFAFESASLLYKRRMFFRFCLEAEALRGLVSINTSKISFSVVARED